MRYLWLAFAFLVAVIGVVVGRLLNLSQPTEVILGTALTFLALFPFVKRWMPKAKFALWALAAAISVVVAWLLYLCFARLGW